MSFFDKIFGNSPAPQQAAPQQVPTNNPAQNQPGAQPHQSQATAPNGVVPPEGNQAAPTQSPTERFKDLWEPVKVEEGKQPQQSAGLTPEQMLEAASKVDFTRVLDQASLAKIQAGGEEAVQALAGLLNKTAQTVYGQSTVVAQKLVETAVDKARREFTEQLPGLVKRQTAQESLLRENPAFKDPAVAPVVAAIQSQLQTKFPNASSSELAEMAQEYFKSAAGVLSGKPTESPKPASGSNDFDWDSWATSPVTIGSGS
jgi:hypothetical protein